MYTKKILSAAAAVAVLSTGSIAFDVYEAKTAATANTNEYRLATDRGHTKGTTIKYSNYTAAVPAGMAISLSEDRRRGDALIYPIFTQDNGYGTEIVVRNVTNRAMVAKAVLYAGEDSEELVDFNLYLSPYDVARFQIKDGKITSSDGSIRTNGIYPNDVDNTSAKNDYTSISFANKKVFTYPITEEKHKKGYVAIFGMVQEAPIQAGLVSFFHKRHGDIYASYAKLLDDTRGNGGGVWRDLKNPKVLLGSLFINNVTVAPNITIPANTTTTWSRWYKNAAGTIVSENRNVDWGDVDNTSLSGEVRMFDEAGHDMLLPAIALSNTSYTDAANMSHVSLWTEGEYASIADRCIDIKASMSTGTTGSASYDVACLVADAAAFNVEEAIYTYANKGGETDNRVVITQPYKRTFMQLEEFDVDGDAINDYKGSTNKDAKIATLGENVDTGAGWHFTTTAGVYNEDEGKAETVHSTGIILSGVDSEAAAITSYHKEVQMINPDAFELSGENKSTFGQGNGFATFTVGVPAIITQMVATKSGSSLETNWIYSTVK